MIITNDGNIPSKFAHALQVIKMAKGFYDSGEDVTLVTFNSLPLLKSRLFLGGIYDFYGISRRIKIKTIFTLEKEFFLSTVGGQKHNKKAAYIIKKQKPNFVYSRSYLTSYHCVKMGIPTIVEVHSTNYDSPGMQMIYAVAKQKSFLGIVTIHNIIKDNFIQKGIPKEKILVLEDGVDLKAFNIDDNKIRWRRELKLPLEKKIIMYCGSLFPEKGIKDILKTANLIKARRDVIFVLVGGNRQQIKKWRQYCQLNYIDNVKFIGFVRTFAVPKYLKAADILLMPYNTNISYRQMDIATTSPLKLFEYMAAKRPIISSNIATISKVIKNNITGLLVEPNNILKIKQAIKDLLSDEEKSKKIASNAFKAVQKYSWPNRCYKIMEKFGLKKTGYKNSI